MIDVNIRNHQFYIWLVIENVSSLRTVDTIDLTEESAVLCERCTESYLLDFRRITFKHGT